MGSEMCIRDSNNTSYNQVDGQSLKLSKIFEWYGEDFGNLVAYIQRYSNVEVANGASVTFLDYDWGLNQ